MTTNTSPDSSNDEEDAEAFTQYMKGQLNDPLWLAERLHTLLLRRAAQGDSTRSR